MTDSQLLELFLARRDDDAFEALVRRHGPMVFGVCRRILCHRQDAEDAFQATFVVLVRKAASVQPRESVGNWLYGVAYRTALEANRLAARRRAMETQVSEMPEMRAPDANPWQDLRPLLDQELSCLPDKYREPIVLCDLEGRSRKEAALKLGVPEGTLSSRLATARRMLARRLARHGLAFSAGAVAAALPANALACVPHTLVMSTVKTATCVASGGAAASVVTAKVAALTEGVLKAMLLTKLKSATVFLLTAGVVMGTIGTGVGIIGHRALAANQAETKKQDAGKPEAARPEDTPKLPKSKVLKADEAVYRIAWNPDGKTIASVSLTYDAEEREIAGQKKTFPVPKSTVQLWDADKGEVQLSLGEEKKVRIESVAFSPDRKTAAMAVYDDGVMRAERYEVRLLDTQTGGIKKTIPLGGTVRRAVFSPDGKTLAIGGQYLPELKTGPFHRTVQLWDMEKEKVTKEFKQELRGKEVEEAGYLDGLRDLAFSPDGKLLAAADTDWKVRLLDTQTGNVQHTLEGHSNVVLAVAFAPDGKTLVSGSFDQTVKVWDVQTGKELRTLNGNRGQVWAVAFSPDGKLLATGGTVVEEGKSSSEVILWDAVSWEAKRVLPSEKENVSAVAFSPDAKKFAVAAGTKEGTGAIKLWRVEELVSDKK